MNFPENNKLVKIILPIIACMLILGGIALVTICKYKGTINSPLILKFNLYIYVFITKTLIFSKKTT